jgi:hypothetical protein
LSKQALWVRIQKSEIVGIRKGAANTFRQKIYFLEKWRKLNGPCCISHRGFNEKIYIFIYKYMGQQVSFPLYIRKSAPAPKRIIDLKTLNSFDL